MWLEGGSRGRMEVYVVGGEQRALILIGDRRWRVLEWNGRRSHSPIYRSKAVVGN